MPILTPFSQLHFIVRRFLWIHLAIFVLYFFNSFLNNALVGSILDFLPLQTQVVFPEVWRVLTYMFVHVSPLHFLANMLFLWMFGDTLARDLSSKKFVLMYLGFGVFAGVLSFVWHFLGSQAEIIGASGALFGLFFVYARMYPDQIIQVFFVFPMRMKYAFWFFILIDLLMLPNTGKNGDVTSHITHLGGVLGAFLWLWFESKQEVWRLSKKTSPYIRFPQRPHFAEPEGVEKYDTLSAQRFIEIETDRILRKINRVGEEELSASEKEFLESLAQKRSIQKKNHLSLNPHLKDKK